MNIAFIILAIMMFSHWAFINDKEGWKDIKSIVVTTYFYFIHFCVIYFIYANSLNN
jgi:hypothetical protein